jgi:hypothetical protein
VYGVARVELVQTLEATKSLLVHARRLSAHVGNAYLRKGNTFLRWRTSAVLAAVREGAVHRLLDTCTETTRGRAQVKTRPQNSHVVKLEVERSLH